MTSGCSAASSARMASPLRVSGCNTGMSCSTASCLTGDGVSFLPRPAGRSGWVSTASSWCSLSSNARSAVAAKSGVPAKRIFKRASCYRRLRGRNYARSAAATHPCSGAGAMHLFQLLANAVALQARDIVDEQLAVEVIQLVLDAYRQQAIGVHLERLAVSVQRLDQHAVRALHRFIEARHRQATLVVGLGLLGDRRHLGVDEHQRLVALF